MPVAILEARPFLTGDGAWSCRTGSLCVGAGVTEARLLTVVAEEFSLSTIFSFLLSDAERRLFLSRPKVAALVQSALVAAERAMVEIQKLLKITKVFVRKSNYVISFRYESGVS